MSLDEEIINTVERSLRRLKNKATYLRSALDPETGLAPRLQLMPGDDMIEVQVGTAKIIVQGELENTKLEIEALTEKLALIKDFLGKIDTSIKK